MPDSRQRATELASVRMDARFVIFSVLLAAAAVALLAHPARSATQSIAVGNYFFGDGTIDANVGDRLRFTVGTGGGDNHRVEISGLGINSGKLDEGDTFLTTILTTPGEYQIVCKPHSAQGHTATLVVHDPPPSTTTTSSTTTTIASTTTTTLPGGSTTTNPPVTTTTSPGATTTTAPGTPTTVPSDTGEVTTTAAGGAISSSSTTPSPAPAGSQPETDGSVDGAQALGGTSPSIQDAAWLRPLWWAILAVSAIGLIWVGLAWRKRPTEYD